MSLEVFASGRLWTQVAVRWRSETRQPREGVSADAIATFERTYEVVLPADVRDYFTTVDGTGEEMENCSYRFWPLAEVKLVDEELSDAGGVVYPDRFSYPNCFVFADQLISCWLYAVRLTGDINQSAPVFRVTADAVPGEQMAPSFREFMTRYVADPRSIL